MKYAFNNRNIFQNLNIISIIFASIGCISILIQDFLYMNKYEIKSIYIFLNMYNSNTLVIFMILNLVNFNINFIIWKNSFREIIYLHYILFILLFTVNLLFFVFYFIICVFRFHKSGVLTDISAYKSFISISLYVFWPINILLIVVGLINIFLSISLKFFRIRKNRK